MFQFIDKRMERLLNRLIRTPLWKRLEAIREYPQRGMNGYTKRLYEKFLKVVNQ